MSLRRISPCALWLMMAISLCASHPAFAAGPRKPLTGYTITKGGDWAPDRIVGGTEVKSWGGSVHAIPFLHERSTTATLARIRGG